MNKSKWIIHAPFIIYLSVLLYITLFAWNYGASLGEAGPGGRNYNLIPFRSIYRIAIYSPSFYDPIKILIGNIVLFIPLGFFLPIVFRRLKGQFAKVVWMGFIVSFMIELIQFTFLYRVADVDDLFLNTAGAMVGYGFYWLFQQIKRRFILFTI
ncbi:VanZ family protein [Alkalihalobacillus pseudalcaliphilus]|uniref:VanZ family protein n=1 Tax=Alkalihalobacillus pseudalcaliphilus TaxID=79884 RepID=UPI00064D8C95|nr:VanZ family protein [Alkalihalobacillus pseudalcaliphilus]KMK76573.1 VanZ family protein [Alkalihalobacillus pseudalcaliphilus]